LCTNKAHFRTEADCHEVPSDGLSIVGDKVCWRLSAALPFDHDGNVLIGASADGILYAPVECTEACADTAECAHYETQTYRYAEDSWFEVNVDLESTLQPWSSAQGQEHTVRAASLGIVWSMSVEGSPSREKAMDLVPSRVAFEADTNGWQV
jgi:hypothetical protein